MTDTKKIYSKEELFEVDLPFILWTICQNSYKDGSTWSKEQFSVDLTLKNSQYLIFMEQNQYVGFVSYHFILDEAEITHVVVNRPFQKNGYAKQLLKGLQSSLKRQHIQHVFLEVRRSNQVAQQLYQKYGFEEISSRKNYYSNPKEDAMVMCLKVRKGN